MATTALPPNSGNTSGASTTAYENSWDVPKWNRHATPFANVAKLELDDLGINVETIRSSGNDTSARNQSDDASDKAQGSPPMEGDHRIGLALSGGGIRSATFSLGVIQSLATNDHLPRFDYLSTVSGGGYAGSWLTAWIARSKNNGGLAYVIDALKQNSNTGDTEPEQVQWLRRYSNYLTPRVGAMSMDALTIAVTWIRNTVLNLITVVALVSFVLLVPLLGRKAISEASVSSDTSLIIALVMALVSLSAVAFNLRMRTYSQFQRSTAKDAKASLWCQWTLDSWAVATLAIFPGFMAAIASSWSIFDSSVWSLEHVFRSALIGYIFFVFVVGSLWVIAGVIDSRNSVKYRSIPASMRAVNGLPPATPLTTWKLIIFGLAAAAAIAVTSALLWWAHQIGPQQDSWGSTNDAMALATRIMTFGPPVAMVCLGAGYAIAIGLIGRAYSESSREWLSRFGGGLVLITACWLLWMCLAFYAAEFVNLLATDKTLSLVGTWIVSLVSAVGLGTLQSSSKSQMLAPWRSKLITLLSILIAAGAFVAIACLLDYALTLVVRAVDGNATIAEASWCVLVGALLFCAMLTIIFSWRVDINRFSLHDMYKLRIIRCYLGASNMARSAQPFTGFDAEDDIALKVCSGQRPFHIINTALNLTQGSELAWQQRKAGSFTMTPKFCGYELASAQISTARNNGGGLQNGYAPTAEYASKDDDGTGMTLGMAIATSGAAVSPNMGANSHPALAVLLTILNLRLGRWSPNSAMPSYKRSSPAFGLRYLISELFGFSSDTSNFLYLSDGGHFDNTGVYELVRRQCTHIVMVDAGADPKRSFQDFGNLVHKCRVDFGVEISLPLSKLFGSSDCRRSDSGFEIGEIDYGRGVVGRILIIKPSLSSKKDEPADIYHYSEKEPTFPQQSTLDQWFDESQFESYRKLGFCLCTEALPASSSFFFSQSMTQTKNPSPAK